MASCRSASHSYQRCIPVVDVSFIPVLKNDQGPQRLTMIFYFGKLLIHQAFNVRVIEDSLSFDSRLAQKVEHKVLEVHAEPFGERNAKAFFLSMNDLLWQQTCGGF